MKKIALMLCMALATQVVAYSFSEVQKEFLKQAIRSEGYSCSIVDSATRSAFERSINVYCDDYKYKYVVKDSGGTFSITPK